MHRDKWYQCSHGGRKIIVLLQQLYHVASSTSILPPATIGARVSTSTRWALGTSGGRSGRTRC